MCMNMADNIPKNNPMKEIKSAQIPKLEKGFKIIVKDLFFIFFNDL